MGFLFTILLIIAYVVSNMGTPKIMIGTIKLKSVTLYITLEETKWRWNNQEIKHPYLP